jgi:SAM-dependent methyltransferase
MNSSKDIKRSVIEKYGAIAQSKSGKGAGCCCGSQTDIPFSMIGDEYKMVDGHVPDADLGLGCGVPTQYAAIKGGDTVLDLGAGAGNDCFVARRLVGESGKVVGLDFTQAMVEKANENNKRLGYENVSFVQGDIEEMPLDGDQFDVILSNCVLNLVPDKQKAFSEMYRVLKSGGRFCISDVVTLGSIPAKMKDSADMYAGCVAGAIDKAAYLNVIHEAGFSNLIIHNERQIEIPLAILSSLISEDEVKAFNESGAGIYSITLSAEK